MPTVTSTTNRPSIGWAAALDGATGATRWTTLAATGTQDGVVRDISALENGSVFLVGVAAGRNAYFGPVRLTFPTNSGGPYLAKLLQHYNQVTGSVFADTDGNGAQVPTDRVFGDVVVQSHPDENYFITQPDGTYTTTAELGTYSVSLPEVPLYHTLPPAAPVPASFATFGNIAAGRDFALRPVPHQQDLQVFLTSAHNPVPGFPLPYQVMYRNIGTDTTSGTVALTLAPGLTYLSNTGGATAAGRTVTLPYAALLPGESRTFEVDCQVASSANIGATLLSTAIVNPVGSDQTPTDNTATDSALVEPGFYRNSVRVNHPRLTPAQVAGGKWLDYTLRFGNTGPDTVSSVRLLDSLPVSQLRLGTLELLTASHPVAWRLAPGGALTATLTGAKLPPAATNPARASGFVRFRVRPAATLQLGDVVVNPATALFDLRSPLALPPALTTIQVVTGLPSETAAPVFRAWPNPATEQLTVAPAVASVDLVLTLLDVTGRPVRRLTVVRADAPVTFSLHGLAPGFYLLRGEQAGRATTQRIIVR